MIGGIVTPHLSFFPFPWRTEKDAPELYYFLSNLLSLRNPTDACFLEEEPHACRVGNLSRFQLPSHLTIYCQGTSCYGSIGAQWQCDDWFQESGNGCDPKTHHACMQYISRSKHTTIRYFNFSFRLVGNDAELEELVRNVFIPEAEPANDAWGSSSKKQASVGFRRLNRLLRK